MNTPQPDPVRAKAAIRDKAMALGFHAVGFAPAHLGDLPRQRLATFLAAGHHGEMAWMAERSEQRADPGTLWPDARTVIALGLSYAPTHDPRATQSETSRGAISVYAQGRDYHQVVKGMLKHLGAFIVSRYGPSVKVFVDTAPVMEKPLAQAAGLGWQGKHTNLVSRDHGSWLFLGEVMTSLDLPPDAPGTDHCGTCTSCLTACPTDAFPAPYRLDATRCISYLTIEHRGPIPEALRPAMGNRIYGCDDCLAVCPWNRFAHIAHESLQARGAAAPLAELAALDDAGFRRRYAGGPVKRIGRDRFVRNVLVAIGNSRDPALTPAAQALCTDPDPVVADAARWAVARLTGGGDTP